MSQADKIMILDIETDNNPYYNQLASPRHPDNYVVAVGWSIDEQPFDGEIKYTYYESKEAAKNWLNIPDDVWLLVMHNASYEIDWFWQQQRDEFIKFIARGGRVFCTQLGHYRLSNMQDLYPALNDIAPLYGGTPKIDAVKLLWDQGFRTSQIDKELLIEYLAGDSGDICNTRKCFYGEYAALVARGMWGAVLAQCDGLIFNAIAMSEGMHIDRDVAFKNKAKLDERIKEIEEQVTQRLVDEGVEVEVVQQFKITSDYHMSAWLYGGVIRYDSTEVAVDADGNTRYVKANFIEHIEYGGNVPQYVKVPDEFSQDDIENFLGLHYGGDVGNLVKFKSGKNKGRVKLIRLDTDVPATRKCKKVTSLTGLINWDWYPADFVKEFIKEHSGKRELADGTPVISSSEEALLKIKYHPKTPEHVKQIIDMVLTWAGANKILGTYFLKENILASGKVGKTSGMLQHLTPENLFFHSLNICATKTGRLSGNAQQFPRDESAGVKEMYTSRFGDDGVISEIDYTALEVVTQACFSKDENLIRTILEGSDMHSFRASAFEGIPYEEFLEMVKNPDHPKHKWASDKRQDIKAPSFAYQYGASAAGIAYATGWSIEEAEKFIENERALFPQVEAFFDGVADVIQSNTTVQREMTDEGKYRVFQVGTWVAPSGITYSFRQYPKTYYDKGKPYEVMEFKPTQMRNYPIQGESSYFVQVVTGWIVRYLAKNNFFDGKVVIFNTVHDAVYLDIHKSIAVPVLKQIQKIMEWIPKGMKQFGYDLCLNFPAEPTVGDNLQNQVKLDDYFKEA